jgi:hypothetical protein
MPIVGEREQRTYFVDRETKLAAAPDEGQAPDIFVVIGPLPAILADRRT